MRVKKIEQIVLTVEEANTLNELWKKIKDLEVEDLDLDEICKGLQNAITEFLGVVDYLD